MNVRDYLRVARQYWWVIVSVLAVVVGFTVYASSSATPMYRSSAAIYVSPEGETPNELSQGTSFLQGQMASYAELVSTSAVLEPVLDELGLDITAQELSRSVSATASNDSVILRVTATSEYPEVAAQKAEAVAASLSDRIAALSPTRADGTSSVAVVTVQEANVPTAPYSPKTGRNFVAALVAGLLLGYLIALAWALLDTRIRSTEQVRAVVKAPVLAEVPATKDTKGVRGPFAEAFHRLCANLDFVGVGERPLLLVVTSTVPGEGKSTAALNLARACSSSGQRVLLIDADMRRPTLHARLGVDSNVGLSTVLVGKFTLREATLTVGRKGTLDFLPSGIEPPNPTQLLGSTAMDGLLAQARSEYDIVIIDSPPVLPVVDALVLAHKTNHALLITRLSKVKRDELQQATETFENSNVQLLGMVINGVPGQQHYYDGQRGGQSSPAKSQAPAGQGRPVGANSQPPVSPGVR